ncbi:MULTISPECIES: response regulator transcription factor [unclassified Mycolicibacterium]|uniref:LuxR C-terminal-related transcriptional regulator n=1 Tax=unclassified Mycolicibacterium TaxID=2636767 RepID=UPI0012DC3B4A|nr:MULTISPECIES: response regulator transcription factor [unclassified Mycolicibacterium]MUL82618.1 response regulator transcription factor [Mycolicibacterium sp. CBMA 329]MUL88953.1 response regulator transcription factor [Mycolicibacterium sp. CBMA 331]MUL97520.1 response regulator transcription factor [Mycolicibacterium sp. CBMA 334]MUM26756.1 response regulator transcription factor [Mycolicibacterium sp. CBMA 295]MUM38469.1 response regulator transcription factor [Mycolicibacterium sp. CBM
MTRLAIAEDNAILRDGLTQLLVERGHEVVAKVGTADKVREIAESQRPDVFVIDIRMPPTFTDEGLVAAVSLRRSHPDVGVLVFSQWVETRYAAELLAGNPEGVGYLLKDRVADIGEFDAAVRRVAAGGTALDPEVVRQLMGTRRSGDALARLTPREREVLALMAEGHSNSALAEHLSISERAVEKHIGGIFTKLDLPPSTAHHRRVLAVVTYLNS